MFFFKISPATALQRGITSQSYDQVMKERSDVNKYYVTSYDADGSLTRTRRSDVFPPSLVGTFRPVYESLSENSTSEPNLLCFEE